MLQHGRDGVLAPQHMACEVDGHHAVPEIDRHRNDVDVPLYRVGALIGGIVVQYVEPAEGRGGGSNGGRDLLLLCDVQRHMPGPPARRHYPVGDVAGGIGVDVGHHHGRAEGGDSKGRSEEHTSELQSLMRISYAVFCLKKKKTNTTHTTHYTY